jgi:hypothetical protein
MLALKVVREMRRALVAAFGTTDDDKMAVTVDDALAALSRLCLLRYQVRGTTITCLPSPDARQAAILNALGTMASKVLNFMSINSICYRL